MHVIATSATHVFDATSAEFTEHVDHHVMLHGGDVTDATDQFPGLIRVVALKREGSEHTCFHHTRPLPAAPFPVRP